MTLFDPFESDVPARGDLHTAMGLVRLTALPGIGPKRAVALADRFSDWQTLVGASVSDLAEFGKSRAQTLHAAIALSRTPDPPPPGIRVIGRFDVEWPAWLNDLSDPPVVVWARGTLPPGGSLAVVGTRQPTEFGESVVRSVVSEAARRGTGIVSGLALGIDGSAHRAALRCGIPTWAILGSGVDEPSPREHRPLADEILEAGGGLLSEQPLGTPPSPPSLVSRNRLQSAASFAVVASQCGIPSGTLHTVRFALQQGRRLVVPRPRAPFDGEPECAGNLALTDPAGCDPSVIGATGDLAREIASRHPLADLVLESSADVAAIWE